MFALAGKRRGAGFTLVELLLVVTIIGVVAGMMAFGLIGAKHSAMEQKTRATIRRLHEALMSRWANYETRRIVWAEGQAPQGDMSPRAAAERRLKAIRELMRMEMPQGWMEVTNPPQTGIVTPAATEEYRRRIRDAKDKQGMPANRSQNFEDVSNAECLFVILTSRMGEEESIRDSMKDSEIGDTDSDGLQEFIDGWGNPILYIRWPVAFDSELQPERSRRAPKEYHDPFDPMMIDEQAYQTWPLIYSAGRDQVADITHNPLSMNDPGYAKGQMGKPADLDAFGGRTPNGVMNDADNIHNHMP